MSSDTIYAPATALGRAAVAVIRVSGPRAHAAGERLAGSLPPPRRAGLRRLRDASGQIIDEALVLAFEAGASFTGEPVVEFQLHGGRAVVSAVLRELGAMAGLRLAEPGEFTRRALEAGRLDLARVEGLADLIDAETEAQRRQAMRAFSGELGAKVERWRARLIEALSLCEASIDFADEEIPQDVTGEVAASVEELVGELRREAAGARTAERLREGFEVAIVGAPNAGKSTLLNALAGREAAITSEIAGTTRDVIEVHMDLGGLPVTFLDTAGLRESADRIEQIGVARALERANAADLRILLLDESGTRPEGLELGPEDIVVQGKADLHGEGVSGKTGQGVPELLAAVEERLAGRVSGIGAAVRERHRRALERAIEALESAAGRLSVGNAQLELAAEDLRSAARALESLTGWIDVEHLLDEIFSRFCLGK